MKKATNHEKNIKNLYLKTLPNPSNEKSSYMICVIGLPGVGKSYLSKIIGKKLNCYIFTSDKVRRFLNQNGYIGNNPNQGLVEYICGRTTSYLLKNKINHIMDSDSIRFIKNLRRKAKRASVDFVLVRVICSEDTALNRIFQRSRMKSTDNFSLADERLYWKRKVFHEKLPRKIFYTFNSEGDITAQVNEFVSKLKATVK